MTRDEAIKYWKEYMQIIEKTTSDDRLRKPVLYAELFNVMTVLNGILDLKTAEEKGSPTYD